MTLSRRSYGTRPPISQPLPHVCLTGIPRYGTGFPGSSRGTAAGHLAPSLPRRRLLPQLALLISPRLTKLSRHYCGPPSLLRRCCRHACSPFQHRCSSPLDRLGPQTWAALVSRPSPRAARARPPPPSRQARASFQRYEEWALTHLFDVDQSCGEGLDPSTGSRPLAPETLSPSPSGSTSWYRSCLGAMTRYRHSRS